MPYQSKKPGAKRNVNVQLDVTLLQVAQGLNVSLSWILEEAIKQLANVRDEDDVMWHEVSLMRKRVADSYKKHLAEFESQQEQKLKADEEKRQQKMKEDELLNIIIYRCCPENTLDKSERGDMNMLNIFKDAIERNHFDKDKLCVHRRLIREIVNDNDISDEELNKLIERAYPSWEVMIKTKWQQNKGGKNNRGKSKKHT